MHSKPLPNARENVMSEKDNQARRLLSVCPQFGVPDVVAAAEYYRDKLGFRILSFFKDPPVFAIVARDSVEIQFGKLDDGAKLAPSWHRRDEGLDAYIWVNDVAAVFEEFSKRGARILEGPVKRIYNCEEILVEDLNGYHIVFAESIEPPTALK
jgi:catechol 2,3-dioxygenase-like lactoylglutathione lyase family enzyme